MSETISWENTPRNSFVVNLAQALMNKWLKTDVALKLWLVFMLSFAIAGYRAEYAILLGALGGITSGFIACWWQMKDKDDGNQADAEQLIGSVKWIKEKIEGQLGLSDSKKTGKKHQRPRMGWFGVQDPKRSRRRPYQKK